MYAIVGIGCPSMRVMGQQNISIFAYQLTLLKVSRNYSDFRETTPSGQAIVFRVVTR